MKRAGAMDAMAKHGASPEEQTRAHAPSAPRQGLARAALAFSAKLACAASALALACIAFASILAAFFPRLDVINHFTPLLALAAACLVAVCGWQRVNPHIAGAAGFALLIALAQMAPELAGALTQRFDAAPAPHAPRLKLITMNVLYTNDRIEDVARFIESEHADIVVIEEARGHWRALGARLAPAYHAIEPYDPSLDLGAIIFTRFEPEANFSPDIHELVAARLRLPARFGGGAIDVIGVHMTWPIPYGRQAAVFPELARLVAPLDGSRAIIAGDFNATPWSHRLRSLDHALVPQRRTRAFYTWPTMNGVLPFNLRAPAPFLPIDHIYAGTYWRLASLRRGPSLGSDHYPLIAEFAVAPTERPALRGFSPVAGAARP